MIIFTLQHVYSPTTTSKQAKDCSLTRFRLCSPSMLIMYIYLLKDNKKVEKKTCVQSCNGNPDDICNMDECKTPIQHDKDLLDTMNFGTSIMSILLLEPF